MSSRLKPFWVCALLLLASGRAARAEPLPSDPSLVVGELENGLRYVVRRHAVPPGRAVVWLHVSTGSMNETDRQRGIAHYLEHMAFNGSEHFPPGALVPFFQSMGMTFGRDQNAFTNMEQTTYQISLPDAGAATLGKGMTYFADVLSRLLLAPKEIDAERQIILEERRRGLSGRQRVRDAVRARIAPGSLWAQRETIGTEATILAVNEQDFRDYYGTWYVASNATVLVVADADPAEVVKTIREAFGGAPKRPRPVPQAPGVTQPEKSFAIVAGDPEVDSEEVRITRLGPVHPPTTTVEQWREDLLLGLGEAAFNRRMEDRISRGDTNLVAARADSGDDGRLLHLWQVSGRPAVGKWKAALVDVATGLQRARKFGFTAHEVDDAKRERLSSVEREVETEATAPAQGIVRRINGAVASGEHMMSPGQRLDLLRKVLPTVKDEEVARRFAAEYDPKAVAFVVVVLRAGPGVPSEAEVLEAGTKALAAEPAREAEVAHATRLLEEPPKPGLLKQGEEHAATGVWTGWFENGACVHHRFLDSRKSEVSVEISLVGGELLETPENRGITSAALVAWRSAATKALSSSDVRELMTGRKVTVGVGPAMPSRRGGRGGRGRAAGAGGGSISLTVSGSPEDLESGFQLAHLLLTQPRIEAPAFEQFQAATREAIEESSRSPLALGMRLAASAPYPDDDVRLQPVTVEQVDRLTLAAAQAWLERMVRESPVEVSIVGDLPRERAIDLATRYVASLPSRERVGPDTYRSLRASKRAQGGPRRVARTVETPTAQAFVSSGIYGPDETDRPAVRAMNVAARVLSTRLFAEVREKAQLVYSIGAAFRAGSVHPGFGVLSAGAPTEPQKAAALEEAIGSLFAAFAASGPTDAEMEVAKKQIAVALEEQEKDPAYWMDRTNLMTFRGVRLDDVAADPAAYQALTAKQVKDVFAKHGVPANAVVVVVSPKAAGAAGGPGAGMDPGSGR